MSITIHNGVRIRLRYLKDFIQHVNTEMLESTVSSVISNMAHIDESAIRDSYNNRAKSVNLSYEEYKQACGQIVRLKKVFRLAYDASIQPVHSLYSIDCGVNLWPLDNYIYAIPYGSSLKNLPEYVEPYPYWNNTDCPPDISARQWRARYEAWKQACIDNFDKCRLHHQVVNIGQTVGIDSLTDRIGDRLRIQTNQVSWAAVVIDMEEIDASYVTM